MYRLTPVEVPDDKPFKNDALDRRPIVEFLSQLIGRLDSPFVLALDAPWGTGKTTLVKMLSAVLRRDGFACVEFNAWETDYTSDPLVALLASLKQLPGGREKAFTKKLGGIATAIARRSLVAATKVATMGALEVDKEYEKIIAEAAGAAAGDLIENFERQKALLQEFRNTLEDAVSVLADVSKKDAILVFVDEIDRCRPSYAIELLERIKHLFDVEKVVFVLSLDKAQLEASVRAVYGVGFNAPEYLRRFIDLDFRVPLPRRANFTQSLFTRFGFEDIFKHRKGDLAYDAESLLQYLSVLSEAAQLSLRAQERCFARIRLVLDQTPANTFLFPLLVALLVVLRTTDAELYSRVVDGECDHTDLIDYLSRTTDGRRFIQSREARILLSEFLVATPDSAKTQAALKKLDEDTKTFQLDGKPSTSAEAAREILSFVEHWNAKFQGRPNMRYVAKKIDLAGQISN